MQDVSGFGATVQIVASNSFPAGFPITQFADDADPFDIPSIAINDKAMGLNGDLIVWSKATPTDITINVINGSEDDANLAVLLQNNRTGRGKTSARDVITCTAVYPDGSTVTLTQGRITNGMPGSSIASAGRMKTKAYVFTFENMISTGV